MINPNHLDEWVKGSGVDEEIVTRNIETLEDPQEVDKRLNRNTDRRWHHWDGGNGWWVSGVDPITNEPTNAGGQFKPDRPFPDGPPRADGSQKFRKYLNPLKYESEPLFLDVPDRIWQQIADKHNLAIEDAERVDGFWKWAAKHNLPIILTEGAKKIGAAFTHSTIAISIPGVTSGQKLGRLKLKLKPYCRLGRKILLGFDGDWRTNPNVFQALVELGKIISAEGAVVNVLEWDESYGKGLDDALLKGLNLDELCKDALTFKEWKQLAAPKKADSDYPDFSYLKPEDEVTNCTIDDHVYKRIFESGKGRYQVISQAFYRYTDKGYWAYVDDEDIEQRIGQHTRTAYKVKRNDRGDILSVNFPYAKASNISSAFSFSRTMLSAKKSIPDNRHLLCFQNCTVNTATGEVLEHSPDHYLKTTIAADYEYSAKCPEAYGEFVCSSFGEDLLEVLQALTSMYLDPTAPYGLFAHLIGPSGSGKGVQLRYWASMFGVDNVRSGTSFSELNTPEGRYQNLTGTGYYYIPDVGGYQQQLRAFYELVDNGPMSARALYAKRNIQVQFNCRFAIGSVDYLQIENSGDGWNRRVVPLPTKKRKGLANRHLEDELDRVKGQTISWALSMSKDRRNEILNNLHLYDRIESSKSDASLAGDPVRSFVDMCLRPNEGGQEKIDSYKLHTWYSAYCNTFGYQRMAMSRFVNHLKTILSAHYQAKRRATALEDPDRPIIPPHWTEIKPLDGVFLDFSEDGDTCKCVKRNCEEGGLYHFAEHSIQVLNPLMSTDPVGSVTLKKENTWRNRPNEALGKDLTISDPTDPTDPTQVESSEKIEIFESESVTVAQNVPVEESKNGKTAKNIFYHPPLADPSDPFLENPQNVDVVSGSAMPHQKEAQSDLSDLSDPNNRSNLWDADTQNGQSLTQVEGIEDLVFDEHEAKFYEFVDAKYFDLEINVDRFWEEKKYEYVEWLQSR